PLLHPHLGQRPGSRRRNLRVDFISRDLKQRLIALHMLALLLEPLRQGSFDNAFAHLGHHYVDHEAFSKAGSRISRSNTRPKRVASRAFTSGRAASTPCCAMEVTGLDSPHGTI